MVLDGPVTGSFDAPEGLQHHRLRTTALKIPRLFLPDICIQFRSFPSDPTSPFTEAHL